MQEIDVCSQRGQGRVWLRPDRALGSVFRFYLQLHLEDRLSPVANLSFLKKYSVQQMAFTRLTIIFYVSSMLRHDDDKIWIKATFIRHHIQVWKLHRTITISTHRTANLFSIARFDLAELDENICMALESQQLYLNKYDDERNLVSLEWLWDSSPLPWY